jgi:putative heme-binding domain-containing protein
LAVTIGAQGDRAVIERLLTAMPEPATLAGIGQGLARRREKLSDHLPHLPAPLREQLDKQISYATRLATDSRAYAFARLEAIHLLAFLAWDDARGPLLTDMDPSQPLEVQQAALSALASFVQPEAAAELIARWKQLTPPLREEAVNVLLSRTSWHGPLVAALEQGDIQISQLSIPQRARLVAVKDAALAPRVQQLLGKFALGSRKEVLDKYQPSLKLQADAMRGAVVYRRECANCHKLGGEGHEVGPNLATIQHRSPQEILIHVLDPNREVSPHFLDYSVRLSDGRVLTGLIASESDGGLVLRRAEGREDAVARSEIDEITASGKSLMPEGLEQKISAEEMADLIRYLRGQ